MKPSIYQHLWRRLSHQSLHSATRAYATAAPAAVRTKETVGAIYIDDEHIEVRSFTQTHVNGLKTDKTANGKPSLHAGILSTPPKPTTTPTPLDLKDSIQSNPQQQPGHLNGTTHATNDKQTVSDPEALEVHTCHIPTQVANSFYRRPLPESLIAFSSTEGRKLFREALDKGYIEGYFSLAEQFVSQTEPAYPNRLWKGPWRWFAEDMLDCCTPLEIVKQRGITFTEFACLARCNGSSVQAFRGDESTLEHFRESIKAATSQQGLHLVATYSRQVLGQTGQGHFSPIGGYHPEKDLALVMDVARFKYAPHWVPVEVLWRSIIEIDTDTQKPRGYYLLKRSESHRPPAVCRITSKSLWSSVATHMSKFESQHSPATAVELIEEIVRQLPQEAMQVLRAYPEELNGRLPREHTNVLNNFFEEISHTPMCKVVQEALSKVVKDKNCKNLYEAEVLSVLLLACPSQLFGKLGVHAREYLPQIRNLDCLSVDVRSEIMEIREQMSQVVKSNCKKCQSGNLTVHGCKMVDQHKHTDTQQSTTTDQQAQQQIQNLSDKIGSSDYPHQHKLLKNMPV